MQGGITLDNKAYMDMLCEKYAGYFNVHRDYELISDTLDIFAEYNMKSQRYFLSKKAVIYSFENFEYCLVKGFDVPVEKKHVDDFGLYLIEAVKRIVKPDDEHMSSFLTGVMVSDKGFTDEAKMAVQKFKYSKNFMLTLRGWCDIRLILADPDSGYIVTNRKGKEVEKHYIINTVMEESAQTSK